MSVQERRVKCSHVAIDQYHGQQVDWLEWDTKEHFVRQVVEGSHSDRPQCLQQTSSVSSDVDVLTCTWYF